MAIQTELFIIIVLLLFMSGLAVALMQAFLFFVVFVVLPVVALAVLYVYPKLWTAILYASGTWLFVAVGGLFSRKQKLDARLGGLLAVNTLLFVCGGVALHNENEREAEAPYVRVPCTPGPVRKMTFDEFQVFLQRVDGQLARDRTQAQLDAAVRAQLPHSCEAGS